MRLWSIHPKYLDVKGLVALWREGLLAKHVLEGRTKGYKNHPQLIRFKESGKQLMYINAYLHYVCDEADKRGYRFDRGKLSRKASGVIPISVTSGQVNYEVKHLLSKLKVRDKELYEKLKVLSRFSLNAVFKRINGDVEPWEVVKG